MPTDSNGARPDRQTCPQYVPDLAFLTSGDTTEPREIPDTTANTPTRAELRNRRSEVRILSGALVEAPSVAGLSAFWGGWRVC